tara:strand:- start:1036 stop:1323 length:288 start_codon:yes stop_codon:yes gene_type:complete
MQRKTSDNRDIKIGDLVYHLLYGKEWVGVILETTDAFKEKQNGSTTHKELALVKMIPGTKYENFFSKMVSKQNKVTDSLGFVSIDWLFKREKEKK